MLYNWIIRLFRRCIYFLLGFHFSSIFFITIISTIFVLQITFTRYLHIKNKPTKDPKESVSAGSGYGLQQPTAACYLGQCRTGFLNGQKSATVVSHLTALTGEKSKQITANYDLVVFLHAEKMTMCKFKMCSLPDTESTLKEFALLFFL